MKAQVAHPVSETEMMHEAYTAEPKALAGWLQEHLGQQLVAYLAGLRDVKTVGRWARGEAEPRDLRLYRLQRAYVAAQLLVAAYGDRTARSWFVGSNPLLDDASPARVLREGSIELDARVPGAARAFLEGGF
jgi:hypothetical protein